MISMAVNEFSGRKSTLRPKLKAASQEERLQKKKEHLKNLLGNSPQSWINLQKKLLMANLTSNLDSLQRKNLMQCKKKTKKLESCGLWQNTIWNIEDKEIWQHIWLCNAVYEQKNGWKGAFSPFSKIMTLKSLRTLTAIAAEVYKVYCFSIVFDPGLKKSLWKNQNSF